MRFIALLLILSIQVQARYFEQINGAKDFECPDWKTARFSNVQSWETFGVLTAKKFGYDHEIPIDRKGVDYIWCASVPQRGSENRICKKSRVNLSSSRPFYAMRNELPDGQKSLKLFKTKEEQYNFYLDFVLEHYHRDQITHPNVGVVLEILSRYYLQQYTGRFPSERYNVGGGVSYRKKLNQNTVGELDILVWDRKTCKVVLVGESKAAVRRTMKKALKKAKHQLQRFRNFLPY